MRVEGARNAVAGVIYVGRVGKGKPGKWGNPYEVAEYGREQAVELYRRDLLAGALWYTVEDVRRKLKGKDLMCWCKLDEPRHSDVLLDIANGD